MVTVEGIDYFVLKNYRGKFSLEIVAGMLVIDDWQGETKTFPLSRIPRSEIADCLCWLDEEDIIKLARMIGKERVRRAKKYAKSMDWID